MPAEDVGQFGVVVETLFVEFGQFFAERDALLPALSAVKVVDDGHVERLFALPLHLRRVVDVGRVGSAAPAQLRGVQQQRQSGLGEVVGRQVQVVQFVDVAQVHVGASHHFVFVEILQRNVENNVITTDSIEA